MVATEINWEVNSSVTDRIMREIEEMRSHILVTPTNTPAKIVASAEENQTINSPPGLVANRKLENGLSQGISVYRGMLDRSVESETYRSPAMQSGMSANVSHYGLATPVSNTSCNEVGVQTECTLSIGLDMIVWEPKLVSSITESKIAGVDAKLEFAVRAQEADVLPERAADGTSMGVGDSDEDETADEIDIGDRAGDGEDNIVGIVGLGKTLENADMGETVADTMDIVGIVGLGKTLEDADMGATVADTMVGLGKTTENAEISAVCSGLDTLQRSLQALSMSIESEDETPASVAERIEVIEERIVPPPQASEVVRKKKIRAKKAGARSFVLRETDSSEEEKSGSKEEADLLTMDGKCKCENPECNEAPMTPLTSNKQAKRVKLKGGITMDTGAHHNVIPKRMVGKRQIRASEGSKNRFRYVGAGGENIANKGEVDFPFETLEEQKMSMTFQIAEVTKPLGAVSYFVDRNYRVVYDKNMVTGEDLSYTVFKPTKEVYRFRRERNIWILDAVVDVADLLGDFSRPE